MVSEELEEKYNKALERLLELETELYFCCRNRKIENIKSINKCRYCNRNDGTCGCVNQ